MVTGLLQLPSAEQRAIIKQSASYELAKRSFPYFLSLCTMHSDDPKNPAEIPFVARDYQMERALAWEQGHSEVIVKPRQMGFSWLLAAYKLWRAMFYGWDIGYYSKGDLESVAQLEKRVIYMIRRLPPWLRPEYRKRRETLTFTKGGAIHAFPATQTAGASYTFQLVIADEAALHKYGAENYEIYRPTLSAGGQYIAASSANPRLGPFGFFFELWTKAVAGISGYDPVFIPWWAHPDRDQEWYDRERAAYPGDKAAFDAQYPSTPDDAFRNKSGLVYGDSFSRDRNVKEVDWTWADADIRVVGVDPGGSDPTAVVPIGYRHTGTEMAFHVFGEFYKRGPVSMMDIGSYLQAINSVAPIHRIVVDPSSTLTVPTLRGMGWPAKTADNDKLARIGQVSHLFRNGLLTIEPTCTSLLYELQTYWFVERRDMVSGSKSPVLTRTAATHHADLLDSTGYAILEAMRMTNHSLDDRGVKFLWR